jgi:branched-chain amino acid transport system ATP-binding protein
MLELLHVEKHFGGVLAVDDLSFAINAGERVALVGPNGAGKTTVCDLITGVYSPDSGLITLGARDITRLTRGQRGRCGMARTFQEVRLVAHLTVLENVMIGQSTRYPSVADMLQPVNLRPDNQWRRDALEALERAGLAGYASRACASLEYGIQKRIEIVRALEARPTVLLLDEPAAGLDPEEIEAMRALLEAAADGGVTLIITDHGMQFTAAFCRRAIVLAAGCKIADCSVAEAQADPRMTEIYLGDRAEDSSAAQRSPAPKRIRRSRAPRSR